MSLPAIDKVKAFGSEIKLEGNIELIHTKSSDSVAGSTHTLLYTLYICAFPCFKLHLKKAVCLFLLFFFFCLALKSFITANIFYNYNYLVHNF